ncbi:2-phosphosulfolactate phosphatase family protein [Synechococcus sp. RSCCF101]|uniref:2-phosphosulfolactate phosphatase family protein n=1 Tax=Synechococcus sp. RSCCF101 TaxID=2511069 RepID=UPI0012446BBF|nr:2-phosphosulfolactate phosphatase family protein [Synechococcus sp. RSCCF101]QEY31460.1 2-phosphosulfolactate phosphatase family protein [Synechococcus sp. RSCCF101]
MQLFVFHAAGDVPGDPQAPQADAGVVIDVLRATTTIAWALHNGAGSVAAFADLGSLAEAWSAWPEDRRLRLGERGGQRLEGFDLGNSPLAVSADVVAGKRLFMSTTNGTRALNRLQAVPLLLTACLPNRAAVVKRLLQANPDRLWLLGSGWEGAFSLEDTLAAGAVIEGLLAGAPAGSLEWGNDEALAALALWQQWRERPEEALRQASHGRRLQRLGDHDADFRCCSQVDGLDVVPVQTEPGVLGLA